MIINCEYCKKEFDKPINKINEAKKLNRKLYCSIGCSNKDRIKKIKCECTNCGKEILKLPSEIKKSKTGNVFCSQSCSTSFNNSNFRKGENNPNWKGGVYSNSHYQKVAYRNYIHKCSVCGFSEFSALQVHHIDKDRTNDSLENLIILCANHHNMVHYGTLEITKEIKNNREFQNGVGKSKEAEGLDCGSKA